jgi:hypothetical protein
MTASFLEFVFQRHFGRGPWDCPYCNHRHFSVQRPKDGHKVKFHCFSCEKFGDEFDVLRDILGVRNYQDRLEMRAAWHADYVRDEQPTDKPHSPRGIKLKGQSMISDAFSGEAKKAIAQLVALSAEGDPLALAQRTLEICAEHDMDPAALAERVTFEIWSRRMEADHMATCNDPECECVCCRRARGWSDEQIKEGCLQAQREGAEMWRQKDERVEEMRKRINGNRKRTA